MKLVDVHAHLYTSEAFPTLDVIAELLRQARNVGVHRVCVVSETLEEARRILEMSQRKEEVWSMILPSAGLHPAMVGLHEGRQVDGVLRFVSAHHKQLKCVGEIGLDFSPHVLGEDLTKHDALKQLQTEVFTQQLYMAAKLNLPVNVHSRSAGHYVLELLDSDFFFPSARLAGSQESRESAEQGPAAICHAFDGKAQYAIKALQKHLGRLFFSIPPSVARNAQTQAFVKKLPLDALLLETDSPALSPEKDQVNCPRNLLVSLQWVSTLKGVSVDSVAACMERNTERVFGKL